MADLTERGKQIRRDTIALSKANGGYHYGGSFSVVEILIALYDFVMKPLNGDRVVLSKGHACWPLYVILRGRGNLPRLEGHPHRDVSQGIEWTTGSMGHGFPAAVGMALAKKIKGEPGTIYVIMGDGECQEGTTWESLLIAGRYRLDNLVVIVDNNQIQGSAYTRTVLDSIHALKETARWSSFHVRTCDGHDVDELSKILTIGPMPGGPELLVAETIKGRGVSFMEDSPKWHACWPNPEQEAQALEELQ
jgi:transketolase